MTTMYVIKNFETQEYYCKKNLWCNIDNIDNIEYFESIEDAQNAMSKMIGIFQIETVYFCN